ncbi:hypothetical protein Bca101_068216 [Brassica carinata]
MGVHPDYPFAHLYRIETANMPEEVLFQVNDKTGKVHALPTLIHHKDYQRGVRPDFNLNDIKLYEDFQIHAFRLNGATQMFPIPFVPNWIYYPIDYQMELDEYLQFFMEKPLGTPYIPTTSQTIKQEQQQPECPPEYFQDAQNPNDDAMNIDEIGRMFNIEENNSPRKSFELPEEEYECPDDHYGCCEKHIIEFEIDH